MQMNEPLLGAARASHYRRPLRHSPFFERASSHLETDSFIPWSGYLTPDVFSSTEQEYFAIRNAASLFDITPMIKYDIGGPDAERFLNRVVTRDVREQKVDRVTYTVWCDDEGHVIDDGTIFRFGPQSFRLCTGERQLDWFLDSAIGYDVTIEEVTDDVAALALQGPTSCSILKRLQLAGIEELKPNRIGHFELGGRPLMVSRTGFTGDLGYELWVAPADAAMLWDAVMEAGRSRGIRPIGYAALEIARIEAGHILPDVDFISAAKTIRLGRESTPFELGVGWAVAMDKGHFNGRRALLAAQARGPRRRIVGLEIDGNKPATDALIYADKAGRRQIGEVTSALWSPTCKRNIALARLDAPYFDSTQEFWVDIYLNRELQWERRTARARIAPRPFFAPERRHLTPPLDR
jgi:aminomethyltransferase